MTPVPAPDLTGEERQIAQELLAARPWDAAEPESLWSITGVYPASQGKFTDCLALVLPRYVTGGDDPLFAFLPPLATASVHPVIFPAWITHAVPLLIVHRDDPSAAYYDDDQEWLR